MKQEDGHLAYWMDFSLYAWVVLRMGNEHASNQSALTGTFLSLVPSEKKYFLRA